MFKSGIDEFDYPEAQNINKARLEHLTSLNLNLSNKSVIDIGSGPGHLAQFFVEKKCDVLCLDGRKENISSLRKTYPGLKSKVFDVQAESSEQFGQFDVVFCYGFLYHTSNPEFVLRNISSISKDLLILESCICDSPYSKVLSFSDSEDLNQALDGFGCRPTPGFVIGNLKKNGFNFVYIPKKVPNYPDFQFKYKGDGTIEDQGNQKRQVFIASKSQLVNTNLISVIDGGELYINDFLSHLPLFVLKKLAQNFYKPKDIRFQGRWILDNREESLPRERDILRRLWKAIDLKSDKPERINIKWNRGIKLKLDLDSETAQAVYLQGIYEPNEFYFLSKFLKKGMVFIDVGANIGLYSLFASKLVGELGRVVAVEPSKREYTRLRENIFLNKAKIKSLRIGVSDREKRMELKVAGPPYEGHNSFGDFAYNSTKLDHVESVKAKSLDMIVQELNLKKIDFVKIDAEGAETAILEGASKTLVQKRPIMFLEISDLTLNSQGSDSKEILSILKSNSYRIYSFAPKTGKLKKESFRNKYGGGNVLALPGEKLSLLKGIMKSYKRPKAIFVEHSYRKKTHATDFLINFLKKTFDLSVVYDESWRKGEDANVKLPNEIEYVFYFQVIPPLEELRKISVQSKIIWFPMYDAVITGKSEGQLIEFSKLTMKVVCFSKTLFQLLRKYGFECIYAQYYVNPYDLRLLSKGERRIYFWYRRDPINWNFVKKLLGDNKIESLIIKNDPDPGFKHLKISGEDIKNFKIEMYKGHLNSPAHNFLLEVSSIYIAPRPLEGIGLSFLEALSRGQCVIAPNNPTLNEYIKNGVNGILYDIENVKNVNIENFEELGYRARIKAKKGFEKWEKGRDRIIEFITS